MTIRVIQQYYDNEFDKIVEIGYVYTVSMGKGLDILSKGYAIKV